MKYLILLLFPTFLLANNNSGGYAGSAGNRDHDRSDSYSFSAPDLSKTNHWVDTLSPLNPASSSFKNQYAFKPLLEVNTNRGSLKTEFKIPMPANFIKFNSLSFHYNHKQNVNYGYGIGWNLSLPAIDKKKDKEKTILILNGMSGSGSYIEVKCELEKKCYRAQLDESFYEIHEDENSYELITTNTQKYLFNNLGQLVKIQNLGNEIVFEYEINSIHRIRANNQTWSVSFEYDKKLSEYPIYKHQRLTYLPKKLNKIIYTNKDQNEVVDFKYQNEYLTKVSWNDSKRSLFWGEYAYTDSKIEDTESLPSIDTEKEIYTSSNLDKTIDVRATKDGEDSIIYIDLNGDYREEKIILHTKKWNDKLGSYLRSLDYESSSDKTHYSPKKSINRVKEEINQIGLELSFFWAQVKENQFSYVKDDELSKVKLPLFEFEITKETKKDNKSNVTYTVYKITPHANKLILADINFDETKDLLLCPVTDYSKKTLGSILKNKESFPKLGKSTLISIAINKEMIKKYKKEELQNINVLENIHYFQKSTGPDCNHLTETIDINLDGYTDLLHGSDITLLSPNDSTLINKSIYFNDETEQNTEEKNIRLIRNNNVFTLISAKTLLSKPSGLISQYKDHAKKHQTGSPVKRLIKHQSDFGGYYKITYENKNFSDVVSKIERINLKNEIENTRTFEYTDNFIDPLTGVFIGYHKTLETKDSAAQERPLEIERLFLCDHRTDVLMLSSRARVQGRILEEITKDSLKNESYRTKYFWTSEQLSDDRIFIYPFSITTEARQDGIYENKVSTYTYSNWVSTLSTKLFPLEKTVETKIQSDIINIFSPPESLITTTSYTNPEKNIRLISKISNNDESFEINYNDNHQRIEERSKDRTVLTTYDEKGRVIQYEDDFGAGYLLHYDSTVNPTDVSINGENFQINRDELWENEIINSSNAGTYIYDYKNQELVSITRRRNNQAAELYKKEDFNKLATFLDPSYEISYFGLNYLIELNEFGESTRISTRKNNELVILSELELIDGKIITSRLPYKESKPRKYMTSFKYDAFGRTILQNEDYHDVKRSTIYNKDCVTSKINNTLLDVKCSNLSGDLTYSSYFQKGYYFQHSATGKILNIDKETKWNYQDSTITSFEYQDYRAVRNSSNRNRVTKYNNLTTTFNNNAQIESYSTPYYEIKEEYEANKIKSQTINLDNGQSIATNYAYEFNLLSKDSSPFHTSTYKYDEYDRIKQATTSTKNQESTLSYIYHEGDLKKIRPYIQDIEYLPNGRVTEVVYKNGLKLNLVYRYGSVLKLIKMLKNGKSVYSSSYTYNKLNQLTKTLNWGPQLIKDLDKNYHYQDNKIKLKKNITNSKRNYDGFLEKSFNDRFEHCGSYLCKIKSMSKTQINIFTKELGLKAGFDPNKNFNPYAQDQFFRINKNELIFEGQYIRLIDIAGMPLGIEIDGIFYPSMINNKNEIIGLLSPDGSEILFIRKMDAWGEKELLTQKDQAQMEKLDNLVIWSFGSLVHSPLEKYNNKDLYYSQSRTYSVSAKQWTALDPLLVWSPESLINTNGNFEALTYCNDDPVNFVDPSGYAVSLAAYLGGAAVVGAGVSAISKMIDNSVNGKEITQNVVESASIGALTGIATAAGLGVGGVLTAALSGGTVNYNLNRINETSSGKLPKATTKKVIKDVTKSFGGAAIQSPSSSLLVNSFSSLIDRFERDNPTESSDISIDNSTINNNGDVP